MGQDCINQKRLHQDVTNLGLRAQTTAVAVIQLCIELRAANILSDEAMARIRANIANELLYGPARRTFSGEELSSVENRLETLFTTQAKRCGLDFPQAAV